MKKISPEKQPSSEPPHGPCHAGCRGSFCVMLCLKAGFDPVFSGFLSFSSLLVRFLFLPLSLLLSLSLCLQIRLKRCKNRGASSGDDREKGLLRSQACNVAVGGGFSDSYRIKWKKGRKEREKRLAGKESLDGLKKIKIAVWACVFFPHLPARARPATSAQAMRLCPPQPLVA